ncbi:MAG: zf-HC2 domain-containing protein [Armatimonadetes bacterium]|nr:zf-HC2 domain-containing protein [Armatimonadota bacterium]
MNCRKVSNLISAYIDGELPGVEHHEVHEHLKNCHDCNEDYEATLQMKRLLSHIKVQAPRPELSSQIIANIRAERETSPSKPPFWRLWFTPSRSLMTVTSALVLVAVTVLTFSKDPNEIRWTATSAKTTAELLPSPSENGSQVPFYAPQGGGFLPVTSESYQSALPNSDWREPLPMLIPAKSNSTPKAQNLTDILRGMRR